MHGLRTDFLNGTISFVIASLTFNNTTIIIDIPIFVVVVVIVVINSIN